jgi:hypothetical protein
MKMRITLFLLFGLLLIDHSISVAQLMGNLMTACDHGTFEASGSELIVKNLSYTGLVNGRSINMFNTGESFERSSERAYEGNWSLKVVAKFDLDYFNIPINDPGFSSSPTPLLKSFPAGYYLYSMWVYIPSSLNPSGSIYLTYEDDRFDTFYGADCYTTGLNNYATQKDRWFKMTVVAYHANGTGYATDIKYATLPADMLATDLYHKVKSNTVGNSHLTLFVDNIELKKLPEINANATVVGNVVTLNPSGGILGEQFQCNWSNGTGGTVSAALTAGRHSVTIREKFDKPDNDYSSYGDCSVKTFYFDIDIIPPCAVDRTVCVGSWATPALSCINSQEVVHNWYEDNNFKGSGVQIGVGPFTVAGEHQYRVESVLNGEILFVTPVKVTVLPAPGSKITVDYTNVFESYPIKFTVGDHQSNNEYKYKFSYGSGSTTAYEEITSYDNSLTYLFHTYNGYSPIGAHRVNVSVKGSNGCEGSYSFNITVKKIEPMCSMVVPTNLPGKFKVDNFSGSLVFKPDDNCQEPFSFGCVGGQLIMPELSRVVAASASTFNDHWTYENETIKESLPIGNDFESGTFGKWRPASSYVFRRNDVKRDLNFNSGTFKLPYFSWGNPNANVRTTEAGASWILANTVEKYNSNGDAIQERNALGIYSTAKYGYSEAVPYLIAQNAEYNSVMFESFEIQYSKTPTLQFEDGLTMTGITHVTTKGHGGNSCVGMNGNSYFTLRLFKINEHVKQKGILVKAWVNGNFTALNARLHYNNAVVTSIPFHIVKRTGDWTLVEVNFESSLFDIVPFNVFSSESERETFSISVQQTASNLIYVDDIRVQPNDSELTAYVYDAKTLRLLTVFDDQHFGLFYQYNVEGKLVRKLIETERGLKTLQETQYNTPAAN